MNQDGSVVTEATTSSVGDDNTVFALLSKRRELARESTTKKAIAALKNDEISLVGIYGMPGVGKTMLMQEIAQQVKEAKLFQEVVTVSVSENPILEKIQRGIAMRLNLKFIGVSEAKHK
ncbi:hypothetical protein IFM89_030185 [Coptis chinensis]|uniref:NB-ARC domain-containing protein n=1 Tax=Coptis chinensis TaxID=261450 RepID=A0A835LD14_9MAGN|nr:hypothetical protein IFM89_030185 [Coptis chinensis]